MSEKKSNSMVQDLEIHLDKFFEMHNKTDPESGLYSRILQEVERVLIQKTLSHSNNVSTKAAKILGINRNTLRQKIKDLKIKQN